MIPDSIIFAAIQIAHQFRLMCLFMIFVPFLCHSPLNIIIHLPLRLSTYYVGLQAICFCA